MEDNIIDELEYRIETIDSIKETIRFNRRIIRENMKIIILAGEINAFTRELLQENNTLTEENIQYKHEIKLLDDEIKFLLILNRRNRL